MNTPFPPDDYAVGANKIREAIASAAPEPGARVGHFIILAERTDDGGDWDTLYCCPPCQQAAPEMLCEAAAEIERRARAHMC